MFRSPSTSQRILAFIAQNSSSSFVTYAYSICSFLSKSTKKSLGRKDRFSWIPLSLAKILIFLWNKFPNLVLLHALAFAVKEDWACIRVGWLDQASLTTPGKEGWESHMGWNLKGFGNWTVRLSSIHNLTGQWSNSVISKWKTTASGKREFHSALRKTLSILSRISRDSGLRFDQVYRGPENPISIILQIFRHSWNRRALPKLTGLPPNLSSPIRTSLKSPTIT